MPVLEGVRVLIKDPSLDNTYEELEPPPQETSPAVGEREILKYIQARDRAEYCIGLTVQPEFDFHGADRLRVQLKIDGGTFNDSYSIPNPIRQVEKQFTYLTRRAGGTFNESRMRFGPLTLNEEVELDDDLVEEQKATLGTIVVRVTRGMRGRCKGPMRYRDDKTRVEESNWDIIKGSRITHTTIPVPYRTMPAPLSYSFSPLPGNHGKPLCFQFRYRSYVGLERLRVLDLSDYEDEEHEGKFSTTMRSWRKAERARTQTRPIKSEAYDDKAKIEKPERESPSIGVDSFSAPAVRMNPDGENDRTSITGTRVAHSVNKHEREDSSPNFVVIGPAAGPDISNNNQRNTQSTADHYVSRHIKSERQGSATTLEEEGEQMNSRNLNSRRIAVDASNEKTLPETKQRRRMISETAEAEQETKRLKVQREKDEVDASSTQGSTRSEKKGAEEVEITHPDAGPTQDRQLIKK